MFFYSGNANIFALFKAICVYSIHKHDLRGDILLQIIHSKRCHFEDAVLNE